MNVRDGGVRWSAVGLTAVASGIVCLVLLLVWRHNGGQLPTLPWLALGPLLLLSAIVLLAGWQVHRSVQQPPTGRGAGARAVGPGLPMSPQRARGALVAAQASALGGAALVGWYLAHAVLAAPDADVASVRSLLLRALASAAAAATVAVCGMVAQRWCRVPPADDDDEDGTWEGLR